MYRFVVLLVLLLILVACSATPQQVVIVTPTIEPTATQPPTPEPCYVQAEDFIVEIEDISDEWNDGFELANSTPRMSLPGVIADLQAIRRRTDNLDPPPCAETVKISYVDTMDAIIDGFLAFVAQESDTAVNRHFEQAGAFLFEYAMRLERLKEGQDITMEVLPTVTSGPTATRVPPGKIVPIEGRNVDLPLSLVVVPVGDAPDAEVRGTLEGDTLECRLPRGETVTGVEAGIDSNVWFVRVEDSTCDGWIRAMRLVMP